MSSFEGFFKYIYISFHQKLMFSVCFEHLLKNLNQGQYRLTYTVLLEKLINFDKKHMVCSIFPRYLANTDKEATVCPFKDLVYCPFIDLIYCPSKDIIQIST